MIAEHSCIKCGAVTRWRYGEPFPGCSCGATPENIDQAFAVQSDNYEQGQAGWRIDPFFAAPCP